MAFHQQYIFRYQSFQIDKSQPLGHGSYGAVYKAKCDQLPCAAKLIHATILDPTDPGADKVMQRFEQECAFLESIRHPNIVQYLGMARDPESRLPVLLMELLDESLTKLLERSQQPLPYYVEVDICHDIALAVAYLHSNDIIHRDLSSNNVLMIAGRRAKVTDFGMSKLAGVAPTMTPLTMCPGTLGYMPPEALEETPRYTKYLDCFSEGVIMIHVCTRLWPEPGPRTEQRQDPTSPTGKVKVPVLETNRRKNHIDKIDPNHGLLPIAKQCLLYQEKERPSSEELCQRLAALKESKEYKESILNHHDDHSIAQARYLNKAREIQSTTDQLRQLSLQLQEKDNQLQQENRIHLEEKSRFQEQIASQDNQLQHLNQQLRDKDNQIFSQIQQLNSEKDHQLQQQIVHEEEIASRERQLRLLNQQLEEQEQVTAQIQQINSSLRRQVEQLQKQLSQQSVKNPHLKSQHVDRRWTSIQKWRVGDKVPYRMCRGAAVVDGNVAYFMHSDGEICSYNSVNKKWSKLPDYPYVGGSLAVIRGHLTAIGGCKDSLQKHTYTSKLLSLNKSWAVVFPPMPTKRRCTTAVTSKEHLIVAGGLTGASVYDAVSNVEVMNTETLVWSAVASLPHPYYRVSAAICNGLLYMLGGEDDKGQSKLLLTCSLSELLQSSSSSSSVWHRIADTPAYCSTCAAVNGELLAFGECDQDLMATAAIHRYDPKTNSWDLINKMPTARWYSLVAVLPTNEIMVVGGCASLEEYTDFVEITKFK